MRKYLNSTTQTVGWSLSLRLSLSPNNELKNNFLQLMTSNNAKRNEDGHRWEDWYGFQTTNLKNLGLTLRSSFNKLKVHTAALYRPMQVSIQRLLFSLERVRQIPESVRFFLCDNCQKFCHLSLHSCEQDVVKDSLVIDPIKLVMSPHISQDIVQVVLVTNFVWNNEKEIIQGSSFRNFKVLFDDLVGFWRERIFLLQEALAVLELGVCRHCCLSTSILELLCKKTFSCKSIKYPKTGSQLPKFICVIQQLKGQF